MPAPRPPRRAAAVQGIGGGGGSVPSRSACSKSPVLTLLCAPPATASVSHGMGGGGGSVPSDFGLETVKADPGATLTSNVNPRKRTGSNSKPSTLLGLIWSPFCRGVPTNWASGPCKGSPRQPLETGARRLRLVFRPDCQPLQRAGGHARRRLAGPLAEESRLLGRASVAQKTPVREKSGASLGRSNGRRHSCRTPSPSRALLSEITGPSLAKNTLLERQGCRPR
jgi:hypothetical protein